MYQLWISYQMRYVHQVVVGRDRAIINAVGQDPDGAGANISDDGVISRDFNWQFDELGQAEAAQERIKHRSSTPNLISPLESLTSKIMMIFRRSHKCLPYG